MARIFISGSSTGLGLLAGQSLLHTGHDVVFHARSAARAADLRRAAPEATAVVVGDLANREGSLEVAEQVNRHGPFDAVIHNAGAGYNNSRRQTADGLPEILAVNLLAPYILTAKIARPRHLIYLSSSMHRVAPRLDDATWQARRWNGTQAYSESKLYVTALALAVARLWPNASVNAVDPGWVPTRMGGKSAPDDLDRGYETQVALALADTGSLVRVSGQYLHHLTIERPAAPARDEAVQAQVLALCQQLSGVELPGA